MLERALALLDRRLRQLGVIADVHVVGGAAMALDDDARTRDPQACGRRCVSSGLRRRLPEDPSTPRIEV